MTPLTPEQLVEKMVEDNLLIGKDSIIYERMVDIAEKMLRVVLDNINDIVTLDYSSVRGCGGSPDIELKPDFANFLRGEK